MAPSVRSIVAGAMPRATSTSSASGPLPYGAAPEPAGRGRGDRAGQRQSSRAPMAKWAARGPQRGRAPEPQKRPIGASSSTPRTRSPPLTRGGTPHEPMLARPVSQGAADGQHRGRGRGRGHVPPARAGGGRGLQAPKTAFGAQRRAQCLLRRIMGMPCLANVNNTTRHTAELASATSNMAKVLVVPAVPPVVRHSSPTRAVSCPAAKLP